MRETEHRSTARVLDILELLEHVSNGLSLIEISEALKVPKSSLFPILHTLLERGYLCSESNGRGYRLGSMAFQLGNSYLKQMDGDEEIETVMQKVVDQCGETCHFAVLDRSEVLYLKKIDSPHTVRMTSRIGMRMPAYGTGLGKALLTDHSLSMLRELYPEGLKPLTEHTVTDMEVLAEQLKQSKETGFSSEREESDQDICCVAVPLRKNGKIVAALSVAVPTFRDTAEKEEQIKKLLQEAKQRIEAILQFTDLGLPNE